MKNDLIKEEIKKFINLSHILFVTAQSTDESSDIDVYCVVKNGLRSQVHIYKKGNQWVEIFIDTWKDANQKIKNSDEITELRELWCVFSAKYLYGFFS